MGTLLMEDIGLANQIIGVQLFLNHMITKQASLLTGDCIQHKQ